MLKFYWQRVHKMQKKPSFKYFLIFFSFPLLKIYCLQADRHKKNELWLNHSSFFLNTVLLIYCKEYSLFNFNNRFFKVISFSISYL